MANQKNESELLFEEYLRSQNLTFEYEKPRDFSGNLINYTVQFDKQEFLFEVKEFDPLNYPVGTVFAYDPYKEIRAKIHEAQKQFRDYGDFACSIVLCNVRNALVSLSENHVMLGAMYGDTGFTMKVDPSLGRAVGPLEPAFLERGKMIRPKTREPQNTRVSALITLREYHVGSKRLYNHIKEKTFSSGEEEWDYIFEISVIRCSIRAYSCDVAQSLLAHDALHVVGENAHANSRPATKCPSRSKLKPVRIRSASTV